MRLQFRSLLAQLRHPLVIGVAGASAVAIGMLFFGADLASHGAAATAAAGTMP